MFRLRLVFAGLLLATAISGVQAGGHKQKNSGSDKAGNKSAETVQSQERTKTKEKNAGSDTDQMGRPEGAGAANKKADKSDDPGRGTERSEEMRERRDERKQIQEDYRADREPGQEGDKADTESGKKPWYKFWE